MLALVIDDAAAGPSAVELARSLLPAWVTWLGVVVFPACAFLVTWIASEFCFALTWRRHPVPLGAHWTDRARAYDVNASALATTCTACAILSAVAARALVPELSRAALMLATVLGFVAAGWGSVPVTSALLRRANVESRFRWRNALTRTLLHQAPWLLLIALYVGLPTRLETWTSWACIAFCAWYFFTGGVEVCRWIRLVRPIDPALVAGVPGVRAERVHVFESGVANACAYIVPRRILVSRRLIEILDPAELAAVLRHEQAHLDESALTHARRLVFVAALVILACLRPLVGMSGTVGVVVVAAALVLLLVGGWLSNTKDEDHADRAAAGSGAEAVAHARALEKLHADALVPAVTRHAVTHPDLFDRMLAAGVTPEWPRPEPPAQRSGVGPLMLAGFLTCVVAVVAVVRAQPGHDRRALVFGLALGGKTPARLANLAELELEQGTNERALVFANAAVELAPRSMSARAVLCTCLVASEQFHRAQTALDELDRVADALDLDAGWQRRLWRARRSLELHVLVPRDDANAPS